MDDELGAAPVSQDHSGLTLTAKDEAPSAKRSAQYQVVEARWHHCGALARKIRNGHWLSYVEAGLDIRALLHELWGASYHRKSWLRDGRIIAMGGLTGTMLSRSARIWFAVAPEAEKQRFAFLRMVLSNLDEVSREKRELLTTVATNDATGRRFAEWLGFVEDGPSVQIGETGVFIVPMVLRRRNDVPA